MITLKVERVGNTYDRVSKKTGKPYKSSSFFAEGEWYSHFGEPFAVGQEVTGEVTTTEKDGKVYRNFQVPRVPREDLALKILDHEDRISRLEDYVEMIAKGKTDDEVPPEPEIDDELATDDLPF